MNTEGMSWVTVTVYLAIPFLHRLFQSLSWLYRFCLDSCGLRSVQRSAGGSPDLED